MTVSIFLKSRYFTNYAQRCYLSHKNRANITVEAAKSPMLASSVNRGEECRLLEVVAAFRFI